MSCVVYSRGADGVRGGSGRHHGPVAAVAVGRGPVHGHVHAGGRGPPHRAGHLRRATRAGLALHMQRL